MIAALKIATLITIAFVGGVTATVGGILFWIDYGLRRLKI